MTYATEQNMIDLFGEKEILELTNLHNPTAIKIDSLRLNSALEYATGEVDSYLANYYSLPVPNPPQVLINKTADIARYHLDSIRSREDVRQRYEDALKWLQLVLEGKVKLSTVVNTGIGFFSEARLFTRRSLNDFTFSSNFNKLTVSSVSSGTTMDSTTDPCCDDTFDGNRLITRPGLPNVTPGGTSIEGFLNNVFYPAIAPQASLSLQNDTREFGGDTNIILEWAVTEQTNPILSIVVEGEVIDPSGGSKSGTVSLIAEVNVNRSFSMSVTDGTLTDNKTALLRWTSKRYWGKINKNGISDPITDADILSLGGAGVGVGNELAVTKQKDYSGINGDGDYLIFAFPSSWGIPNFKVNGFPFTAMTKVRDDPFVNSYGYLTQYQVWASNTVQYVPLSQFLIL
jgi:phage gp36-like protein